MLGRGRSDWKNISGKYLVKRSLFYDTKKVCQNNVKSFE
jgi:hypothetical protein